jgi:hypothetical protein
MRQCIDRSRTAAIAASVVLLSFLSGCGSAQADNATTELFPREPHLIVPTDPLGPDKQISTGAYTGEAPVQPIAFPHKVHAVDNGMQCQYCHTAAKNSIHGGVPELQTCMGCHKYVKTTSPEIKLLAEYWKRGEAVPWKKVHDLPDFVYFSHMRHVRAGVECTECHGQVQLQAGKRVLPPGAAAPDPNANPTTAEEAKAVLGEAQGVMIRETTMQMGWCLDCHASHPSIDKNYGEKANLRRAELKDCWTCHK